MGAWRIVLLCVPLGKFAALCFLCMAACLVRSACTGAMVTIRYMPLLYMRGTPSPWLLFNTMEIGRRNGKETETDLVSALVFTSTWCCISLSQPQQNHAKVWNNFVLRRGLPNIKNLCTFFMFVLLSQRWHFASDITNYTTVLSKWSQRCLIFSDSSDSRSGSN